MSNLGIVVVFLSYTKEFHNKGLWVVDVATENEYRIVRMKISREQLKNALEYLASLNEFGHENK